MSWFIINDKSSYEKEIFDIENDVNLVFEDSNIEKEIVLCIGKVQSGKTNKMFKVFKKALSEFGYDIVIILAGTTTFLVEQTNKRLLEQKDDNFTYLIRDDVKFAKYKEGNKYVLSVFKNNTGLEAAYDFLYTIDKLSDKKILILDDESDFASVNIKQNDLSSTYSNILKLYNFIYNGKLLQVTATPFANIVSSNSTHLYPRRAICWSNPDSYTGLNEFDENKDITYTKINCDKYDPLSYKNIIDDVVKYFITTIINNYDFLSKKDELSCLFNVDLDTDTHKIVIEYINWALKKIPNNLQIIYEKYIDNNEVSYEKFYQLISNILKEIQVIELNSTVDQKKKKKYNFYVGGTLISRGNTFENLITEMIINNPKIGKVSVDTLLQRCRWFGYRNDIFSFMKIFMTVNIYESLIESKQYISILTNGQHSIDDLCRKIKILDSKSVFVKSTGKE